MSEITKQVQEGLSRLDQLKTEITARESSAKEHERQAREDWAARTAAKKELEELQVTLRHARVIQATEQAETAAVKAQKDTEAVLKRLEEKERTLDERTKQVDALLAAAKKEEKPPTSVQKEEKKG